MCNLFMLHTNVRVCQAGDMSMYEDGTYWKLRGVYEFTQVFPILCSILSKVEALHQATVWQTFRGKCGDCQIVPNSYRSSISCIKRCRVCPGVWGSTLE